MMMRAIAKRLIFIPLIIAFLILVLPTSAHTEDRLFGVHSRDLFSLSPSASDIAAIHFLKRSLDKNTLSMQELDDLRDEEQKAQLELFKTDVQIRVKESSLPDLRREIELKRLERETAVEQKKLIDAEISNISHQIDASYAVKQKAIDDELDAILNGAVRIQTQDKEYLAALDADRIAQRNWREPGFFKSLIETDADRIQACDSASRYKNQLFNFKWKKLCRSAQSKVDEATANIEKLQDETKSDQIRLSLRAEELRSLIHMAEWTIKYNSEQIERFKQELPILLAARATGGLRLKDTRERLEMCQNRMFSQIADKKNNLGKYFITVRKQSTSEQNTKTFILQERDSETLGVISEGTLVFKKNPSIRQETIEFAGHDADLFVGLPIFLFERSGPAPMSLIEGFAEYREFFNRLQRAMSEKKTIRQFENGSRILDILERMAHLFVSDGERLRWAETWVAYDSNLQSTKTESPWFFSNSEIGHLLGRGLSSPVVEAATDFEIKDKIILSKIPLGTLDEDFSELIPPQMVSGSGWEQVFDSLAELTFLLPQSDFFDRPFFSPAEKSALVLQIAYLKTEQDMNIENVLTQLGRATKKVDGPPISEWLAELIRKIYDRI